MGDDYMSALDEILASTETAQPPPPPQPPMKSAKEMLGDRLRTQMGGEKRKLEDPTNGSELMSKTQKMDSDLDAVAAAGAGVVGGGLDLKDEAMNSGGQKLLAKALMEKRPPPGAASMGPMGGGGPMGMKPPPDAVLLRRLSELHKEQKHEEINALLSEHPQLKMKMMKMHQQQQQQQQQQGMNRMNNNMTMNDNNMIMNNDNFYGGPPGPNMGPGGPQQRIPMQQAPHPRQQPMGGGGQWGGPPGPPNGNMCQTPAMFNQHKMGPMRPQGPQRGGFFNDGGPPPNAWVQPNDPNKMMGNGPPPAYYNRNGCPRPPMMRPGSYDNFNGAAGNGGQMYHGGPNGTNGGNMRGNYNMDPYANSRFGSPNNVNQQQPMFSPNNGGGNDSMHALRMSANFPTDSNAGYNGYNNEFGGQNPNNFNPRMRPNFVNQNMSGNPMYNRVNMPQSSPMNDMNNMGFQPQQQQQQPQPQSQQQPPQVQQQQQQNFMNGNFDPNFPSPHANSNGLDPVFGDLNNGGLMNNTMEAVNNSSENEWKSQAGNVRQTLLAKLKEALVSQNYPNAVEMAVNYEERSFMNANSLQDYQYKLVEWLACIYDSTSSKTELNLDSPSIPDSSTNGLPEVTTSGSSPKQTEGGGPPADLMEAVSKDDLLATPKSENGSTSCLSPSLTSPCSASSAGVASPLSSSTITTVSNNTSMSATTTSTSSSTSSTTFQCPVPPSQQSEDNKSTVPTVASTASIATPTARPTTVVPTSQNPQPQQRRISGSGNMQQPGLPISSIGNNPQSVDSGIGLGSPRSITSGSSSTLYSPKIQGTSPSLLNSDNSPEKATNSS